MKKKILKAALWNIGIILMALLLLPDTVETDKVSAATASQASVIANYALSQVGMTERSIGSDDIIYNDWYYKKRVKNTYSGQYSWCQVFVSYCANQCGISTNIIPKKASCQQAVNWFSSQGRYHKRSSGYLPKIGDIVYFSTDGTSTAHHVGIVYNVDNSYVYYVDGNNTTMNPHGVCKSKKVGTSAKILGYASPNYIGTTPDLSGGVGTNAINTSITNVRITDITSNELTVIWDTVNCKRTKVVVTSLNNNKTLSSDMYSNNNGCYGLSFTFKKSMISGCGSEISLFIYGYSNLSGAGENETIHRVMYGNKANVVQFMSLDTKYYIEHAPSNLVTTDTISGWVASEKTIIRIQIHINAKSYAATISNRSDVASAYPDYLSGSTIGFQLSVNPSMNIVNGDNKFKVIVYYNDGTNETVCEKSFTAEKPAIINPAWIYAKYCTINTSIKAIGYDPVRLEEYWYQEGCSKGIAPSPVFDFVTYKSSNPDVAEGYRTNTELYYHFVHYAIKNDEMRKLSPFFDLTFYMTYDDLKKAYGNDVYSYIIHYLQYGIAEGRLGANTREAKAFVKFYNCKSYAKMNADVKKVYGSGTTVESSNNLFNHFLINGIKEQRQTSNDMDIKVYCLNTGITSTGVGFNVLEHYINTGYAKNIKSK